MEGKDAILTILGIALFFMMLLWGLGLFYTKEERAIMEAYTECLTQAKIKQLPKEDFYKCKEKYRD